MASACNRFIGRSSLSSLKSAMKSTSARTARSAAGSALPRSPLPAKSSPSPPRSFSFSRCPAELGGVQSLLPLHSTVAAARLTSCLSTTSRSSRALSQAWPVRPKVTYPDCHHYEKSILLANKKGGFVSHLKCVRT